MKKPLWSNFITETGEKGLRIQEEFASAFRIEYQNKDHCPCLKVCRYHGNCKECVAIHRAHQEHVPNCMRPILNQKICLLSELTEHTITNESLHLRKFSGSNKILCGYITQKRTEFLSAFVFFIRRKNYLTAWITSRRVPSL